MAFESNTLVNGEWTTRTLDVNTVLRHYDQQDRENSTNQMDIEKTPKFGVLTQTVIRSPLVHWILPVRLRDSLIHDVAFIGDDFVQIKELRSDGLLWDVTRKEDFGARIRNAAVIGSVEAYEEDPDAKLDPTQVKSEEEDTGMSQDGSTNKPESVTARPLPPQFLVLQLETGDSIFLMLQENGQGKPQFITSTYRVAKSMLRTQPGTHIAVDPTSRYMAVGCSEGIFAIYELQKRENLKKQFLKGKELNHIALGAYISVVDTILNIKFLYPPTGPDYQDCIILLVLVIRKGKTRMMIYEWDAGADIRNVKPESIKGHQLDKSRQMPLLLIPLMIKSAFVLVCQDSMSVCEGMVSNSPTFTDFNSRIDPSTTFHNGVSVPLWTSWTRPARRKDFLEHSDNIFIAREDGLIKFLHINKDLDVEDNNIGEIHANCGTAFASLDFKGSSHKDGDLLVTGGDSCSGGTYLLEARKTPVLTEPVQNWTPTQDIVTTYVAEAADSCVNGENSRTKDVIPRPDRIFVCAGKGLRASITEIRRGLEARIGLVAEYDAPVLQAWALPSEFEEVEDFDASLFLLSLGDTSTALALSSNASDIAELDESSTKFDLRNRTIAVAAQETSIVQVTEKTIRVIGHDFVRAYEVSELPGMVGTDIDNATISDGVILFTTYIGNSVNLQILDYGLLTTSMDLDEQISVRTLSKWSLNITSLLIEEIAQNQFAIVAKWSQKSNGLTFRSTSSGDHYEVDLLQTFNASHPRLDAVISLVIIPSLDDNFLLLCGTRNGLLITLEIHAKTFEVVKKRIDLIGATLVVLTADEHPEREYSFFVSCDSKLYHLQPVLAGGIGKSSSWYNQPHSIHQIWLSDAANPCFQQPPITNFAQLRQTTSPTSSLNESLLLISGNTMFLADLSALPKVVPRHIHIGGTPTRLLYSRTLHALIVAVNVKRKSALQFIDPDTGEDLSQAISEETKLPVEFVSGLGHDDEKIFRLFEWAYTKDRKTWNFLIVATSTGRLLIIAIDNLGAQANSTTSNQPRPRIKYYTRHKFKSPEPVYSITGFPEGLLWCAGTKLYCDILDQAQKKFVRVAEYDLPSPAINLEYSNGTISALTQQHSLELLKLILNVTGESSIVRTHGDQLTRNALHHSTVHPSPQDSLHLVSDKECSLVGLWPITNTKADTLETVFEAELSHSVLRFRSAKCRPIWDRVWNGSSDDVGMNGVQSTGWAMSQPETLGISIMGSLSHFTALELTAWKYLRFLMDLAIRSPDVCEFTYISSPLPLESVTEPKLRMHIDGDVLKRCLIGRHLERLLLIDQDTPDAKRIFARFCEVLCGHHGGGFTHNPMPEEYIEQAYADLAFFLRPVL